MKKLQSPRKLLCAVALLCSAALTANAQNIVVDGGFEMSPSPAFGPAWTNVDSPPNPFPYSGVGDDSAFAREGRQYAFLGATPDPGSLSQMLATTPGTYYTLSFSLANDSGFGPSFFQALFNGVPVLTLNDPAAFDYIDYQFGGLLATGASTSLEFRYMHDDDFFRLDAVSVAAPELPSTGWLALPTVVGLLILHSRLARRRRISLS